ncbi:hypothetical protein SpCBS45565_g00902 [Spizellomyces sp. 'palustris']|nr:hypothetical protein SpCBS45565_g00902 [Spizellomyces sp. 'palustris']
MDDDVLIPTSSLSETAWFTTALIISTYLFFQPASYGRFHSTNRFTLTVPGKAGWFIQELVSPICFLLSFFLDREQVQRPVDIRLFSLGTIACICWTLHYFNRVFVYTYRAPHMSPTRIEIVLAAILFNLVNGTWNGAVARKYAGEAIREYDKRASLCCGIALFLWGMYVNIISDNELMRLRRQKAPHQQGSVTLSNGRKYFIPEEYMHRFVSCANYFGEIVEWTGYALLMDGETAALGFWVWTLANLIPRAVQTNKWYRRTFGEKYPKNRKAVIPFVL